MLGILLVAGAVAHASGDSLLFAGGAGCDGSDGRCERETPEAERVIQSFLLTDGGNLAPLSNYSVPGIPAWLVSAPQLPRCLFAALADISTLLAFEVSGRGELRPAATVKSGGVNPVFASVSDDGRVLLVANYHGPDDVTHSDGASVATFRIGAQCELWPAASALLSGSSVVHGRQDSAHPHSFVAARGGIGFVCDLGQDAIFSFIVGPAGELRLLHRTAVQPGDGPRHMVQHPFANILYVVNELACTVTAYKEEDRHLAGWHSGVRHKPGLAEHDLHICSIAQGQLEAGGPVGRAGLPSWHVADNWRCCSGGRGPACRVADHLPCRQGRDAHPDWGVCSGSAHSRSAGCREGVTLR